MNNQSSQIELSKPELVAKLKGLIDEAKNMPLEEISGAIGVLDTGVNRPKTWQALFRLAEEIE